MPSQVSCICPVCKEQFFVTPARIKVIRKGGNLCCSISCKQKCRVKKSAAECFWSKVSKTESCWMWTGAVDECGYGKFKPNGIFQSPHRFSWELHFGPIPEGLRVLHNCPDGDNPACVNPAHLFLGTQKDNVQDCISKRRRAEHVGHHKGWCYR